MCWGVVEVRRDVGKGVCGEKERREKVLGEMR